MKATNEEFHPLQYAAKLMETIGMPHTQANARTIAAAVAAEAKAGRTMSEAYLWLEEKAKAAQDDGVAINKFWFEDRKWMRGANGQQQSLSKTEQRIAKNRAAIIEGLYGEDPRSG